MPSGFGRMPIESEVGSRNRQVGRYGQFLAGKSTQQGAVIPTAEANGPGMRLAGLAPEQADGGKLAPAALAWFGERRLHPLRIGQISGHRTREWYVQPSDCWHDRCNPFARFADLP